MPIDAKMVLYFSFPNSVWECLPRRSASTVNWQRGALLEGIPNWKFNAINLRADTQVCPYKSYVFIDCRGEPVCSPSLS